MGKLYTISVTIDITIFYFTAYYRINKDCLESSGYRERPYILWSTNEHDIPDLLRLCLPIIIWINIKSLPFNQGQTLVISSISFQLANTDINPFVGNPFLRWLARVKFFFDPTELHISCGYPNFKCRLGYFINLNAKGGMSWIFQKLADVV